MTGRAAFVAWLRDRRAALVAGPDREAALAVLGLDDASLQAWAAAPRQVATLPHASPNVFFPRVGVAWYARHLQRGDPSLLHVRVPLTHVNFSDLGWRPYAWWRLDGRGALRRDTLFTRNKRRKHVVVASQPPLAGVPAGAAGADAGAARMAAHGTDRAISYVLLSATIERAAGLACPGRTVYVPLPLLVGYARACAGRTAERPELRWAAGLLAAGGGRRIAPDGRLAPVADPRDAYVLDNAANLALLALLGEQRVIGGAKMAGYWPEVRERWRAAGDRAGERPAPPEPVQLPAADYAAHVAPSPGLAAELARAGLEYAQGLALAEHGAFAERADPFA